MPNTSDKRESPLAPPEPTDYHDRLLTANAQQYRRITNILAGALPVISRRVGPLEQDEIIYCDCVTSGRFTTDSFARRLRDTARFAEAARGGDH